ncbi:multifunctional oxoglutarate decarboxylase/oxoglutarate dehydrogenase thiamine pyrophosphate-binding subunit/dihydrolipoyllysine-residue succinyltransferase subunit [Propionimicrobium sp. PCR01-08-3]|uniref:multifunctional oxoglutarate decarboxylase/oxoglutarate dehydrogenase thiamine pyrophosphate-binding subunit/dihydrolipoyllysine-residue succinyltransferase subunit n=1 Tax=Propionimicrobium sp. PCR01-08-3 TaxID=3052086 RepID=UPI00255C69AC|nr:multifunctional oxoglutarate decarboxylase/oxoglutarate dehydrogenase thiamine pyrophosphate-binding subunit/dihydrolipoyllysine-residue succinyltransferase subunit [Propionimicrobium sp. PCR01-08-3]WIY84188.1 multifunctional oxoglutarate decarboxylase/oxoglutarate dehydrogenase thiamine pyrophosphate-binding subunit/dihydrolipoyllysine-residue succinyltransferase subunit [Propionimicrobium sp. PCR01-08-3]
MSNFDDFGANDWLIEDMRERYENDPSSVDPQWVTFFSSQPNTTTTPDPSSPTPPPTPASPSVHQQGAPATETAAEQPSGAQQKAAAAVSPTPPVATVEPKDERTESPSQPGTASGLGPEVPNPYLRTRLSEDGPRRTVMKGAPMRTARNMDASRSMPTATSVRSVPMKLVLENRATINNFLRRSRGGKVSFTHIIGYAMIQAIRAVPSMNCSYDETADGKPVLVEHQDINLGIAVDVVKGDQRQLLVPNIKACEDLNFAQFYAEYEALIHKARDGKLVVDDFAHTTASLTNPGGLGTNMSVPRLMPGQGLILGVGSIAYAPDFEGTSQVALTQMAVSKVTTLTSTYDHRVIQGAQSGEFLRKMHQLLLGADGFYEQIFEALRIPYPPLKWAADIPTNRTNHVSKQARVVSLVNSFRHLGHLQADVDPLEYKMRTHPDLELETHGLTLWDLDREFPVGRFAGEQLGFMTLRQILDVLRDTYSHTMGIEYMHIHDPEQRQWFQQRLEAPHQSRPRTEHLRILDELSEAEVFETFLQTKYVGQTRFSMEGAESAIVILSEICELAADDSIAEICIGMPHRGRLNVLANIVGKAYSQIFREFDNRAVDEEVISGDVKYHLGSDGEYTAASGRTVRTSLAANPSHLEAVDPVLEGIARAKNDRLAITDSSLQQNPHPVLPVLTHGDASFAGQGVIYETLQMSQLRPYRNGGTIHLVVNNQIGFTTGPADGRSSVYATDVAKAVQAPVIHVNGDDPDSCALAAQLAFEYRQRFAKDVVIDMLCYRRRGHNEGDEPSFTQPLTYGLIEKKRPVRKLYTEQLIGRGDISLADAEQAVNKFRDRLEEVFTAVRDPEVPMDDETYRLVPVYPSKRKAEVGTAADPEQIEAVASVYSSLPQGFHVHPKLAPQLARRVKAIHEGPIDWATGELLAFGSLLMDGYPVRLVGQDTRRGTFSQRFGAIVDHLTSESWVPLKHLSSDQAPFDIYDSLLSEYAAIGFEYGYSVAAPGSLVCWEAQYGDFANGGQTILDEFVASGFAKWTQKSGVVLLLPHGYEGAGPDHSSARIERFLQMCAGDNMAVCQPSTPASYFHLLRQHAQVNWHRPLVVATPKSMLRNKLAVSQPEDFTSGTWRPVLPDPTITDPSKVERILLCSGKIRWDLVQQREQLGLQDKVAILTLERIFPLPDAALAAELEQFGHVDDIRWVQDEPANQGPWEFLRLHFQPAMSQRLGHDFTLRPFTRPMGAAASTGSSAVHRAEEQALLESALSAGQPNAGS